MSDLAKWSVQGPVHTLRTEHEAPHFTLVRFHPDGRIDEIEYHNRDASVSRSSYTYDAAGRIQETRFGMDGGAITRNIYSYDESGRLTRIVTVDPEGREREPETYSYSQDGKRTRVSFIPKQEPNAGYGIDCSGFASDETGAPLDEVLLYDDDHRLVNRLTYKRDSAGRLVNDEMHAGEQGPFPNLEKALENASPAAREALMAMLADVFGPHKVLSSRTYTYDGKGRLVERRLRMGELGGHRTTHRYDDRDNLIEETTEHTSHDMQFDEAGKISPTKDISRTQHLRFEHTYDAHGNWTEQVVFSRLEPNPNFERSNAVRRVITYYDGDPTSA
jgi:YD repeat-containing protein